MNQHLSFVSCCAGLVIAYCLQAVFGVKFTNSVDSLGAERFNVYGALRTLSGDGDEWYIEAKEPFAKDFPSTIVYSFRDHQSLQSLHSTELFKNYSSALVSNTLVSMHYISQLEATILFNILSKTVAREGVQLSESALRSLWPHNDKDAGHYSRWKFICDEEVRTLLWFLTEHVHVLNSTKCEL